MDSSVKSTISQIAPRLRQQWSRFQVSRAWLFGSRAGGESGASTDWDFLVEFSEPPSFDMFMGLKAGWRRASIPVSISFTFGLSPAFFEGYRERPHRCHVTRLRLADIVESCARIAAYIEKLDTTAFATDLKTQDAVIRQFEIIGEAVKGLPQDWTAKDPSIPLDSDRGFPRRSRTLLLCGRYVSDLGRRIDQGTGVEGELREASLLAAMISEFSRRAIRMFLISRLWRT